MKKEKWFYRGYVAVSVLFVLYVPLLAGGLWAYGIGSAFEKVPDENAVRAVFGWMIAVAALLALAELTLWAVNKRAGIQTGWLFPIACAAVLVCFVGLAWMVFGVISRILAVCAAFEIAIAVAETIWEKNAKVAISPCDL